MCGAWQLPVPAIGLTCFDHRQPGWKVARPTAPASVLTSSSLPVPSSNGRVSSGVSRLLRISPVIAPPEHVVPTLREINVTPRGRLARWPCTCGSSTPSTAPPITTPPAISAGSTRHHARVPSPLVPATSHAYTAGPGAAGPARRPSPFTGPPPLLIRDDQVTVAAPAEAS